jgi:hemerythrin-like metal-binding protein
VGNEVLDNQHRTILDQCNALSNCTAHQGQDSEHQFRAIFSELLMSVRQHFSTEEALLSSAAYPELDGHLETLDEFEDLAANVITTDNFEIPEIQRFVALWWVGHLIDSAKKYRPFLDLQRSSGASAPHEED